MWGSNLRLLGSSSASTSSGTYDDYSVPRTIVDFSGFPQAEATSGEYGRFDSFRCEYPRLYHDERYGIRFLRECMVITDRLQL